MTTFNEIDVTANYDYLKSNITKLLNQPTEDALIVFEVGSKMVVQSKHFLEKDRNSKILFSRT